MKKALIILLSIFLVSPVNVFAEAKPKVLTLNAENDTNEIRYSGTTENGSHAVMCKLYDADNKELEMLSVAVDNNAFEGTFTVTEKGEYKVACANYEGGEIKETSVNITSLVKTYTVTFNTNGGSNVAAATVEENKKVAKPNDPEKEGYTFDNWYEDETLTRVFDFNTPITNNVTLYANWNEEVVEAKTYTVAFNTNGGNNIADITINENEKVAKPDNPEKEGYTFDNWYEDETLTRVFDFNTPVTSNLTLYANWIEDEKFEDYTVTEGGVSISFKEEEGHEYELALIDILPLTDEELAEIGATREEYNEVKNAVVAATKEYGDILAFYAIEIIDEDDRTKDKGEFNIKIKLTDEMKKFNTFKLIYIKDDFTIEEPITLTVDGDYLVGKLPHLSAYALVGSTTQNTTNPKTGDNIYMWISILIISMLGMIATTVVTLKTKKSK